MFGSKRSAQEIRVGHMTEEEKQGAAREADVLSRMHHSNIVSYVESFADET